MFSSVFVLVCVCVCVCVWFVLFEYFSVVRVSAMPHFWIFPDIGKSVRPIRKPSGNPTDREFLLNEVVRSHHAESSENFVRLLWHPWCMCVCVVVLFEYFSFVCVCGCSV